MPQEIRKIEPSCNLLTIRDGRGGIFTFIPERHSIQEWSLIYTKAGENRGYHFHRDFDEYVLVTSGHGVYTQWVAEEERAERLHRGLSEYPFVKMAAGDCIYFPAECPHTLTAITDMRMVALLTRRWDECEEPLTRVEMNV